MKFDIVSLGEAMYEFSQMPGREREYLQGFGGDTMNCVVAAARQGARVAYLTRLGDDDFGRRFLALWKDEGIDTSGVSIDAGAHTAVYFITHGPNGHVFSYLRTGSAASRITPANLARELLGSTRFVHTSGITQAISANACDTAFAAIEIAKATGAQFVYDANLRPKLWPLPRARAIVTETLRLSQLFLLSMEDADALCGLDAPDEILDWCLEKGASRVVLKLGSEGVFAGDAKERRQIAGYKVKAVDATGAGDCFAGTLMARLSSGDDFWAALRYANAAAALTCTGYGAVGPLPRPEAVLALLAHSAKPAAADNA